MIHRLWAVLLLCLTILPVHAEIVDWALGRAVDCPLPASTPSHVQTRTIVVPGGSITEAPAFWDETQLYAKIIRNTIILELRDPLFAATMQIFDDKGNLYLLNVHGARSGEQPDEIVMLRPAGSGPGSAAGGGAPPPADADAQVTELMAAMVGGSSHAQVQGSIVTRVEDGKLHVGRRIFADDTLSLELIKVFQGPTLRGYQCLLRYQGTQPVRLDQQRLWFPGALAVYASSQVFLRPDTVGVEIQPHQAIQLFYVAE